ncbi:hypothetical protein Tco_1463219 [Tanacetum coccineum]
MFIREELVVEHHVIVTSVQMIENIGDGDSSIVLQELAVVKERIIAIKRFIKSKNDSLSEDLVAKHKENESGDGKGAKSVSNEFVLQQLQSRDGKLPESSFSDVLNGEVSCDKTVEMNTCPKNLFKMNMNLLMESSPKDNAGFDFDNTQNHSLNDMVRTEREDIHLDELVFQNGDQVLNMTDFVQGENYENYVHVDQTPVEQQYEVWLLVLQLVCLLTKFYPMPAHHYVVLSKAPVII